MIEIRPRLLRVENSLSMTVSISAAEVIVINNFIKALGCTICANVTAPETLCQVAYVVCEASKGGYGLSLTASGLTGSIDGALFQRMPTCIRLALERNSLTGTLPAALFDNASPLLSLYLNSNRLSGTLPPAPTSTKLEDFRVSGNRLQGTIPLAYFSLPRMFRLHFSDNLFSGDFPRPPANTSPNLDNFYGGNNQFTGTIGTEWAFLTKFKGLHFQGYSNRLTGTIPDLFATHRFAFFNFDNNSLSGTIPSSLSRQSALTHLNIAHNLLSGTFLAPRVRDFCVINNNQFDSCVEQINATVLCCNVATQLSTRGTNVSVPTASGTLMTMTTATTVLTTIDATFESVDQSTTAGVPMSTTKDDAALIGGIVGAVALFLVLLLVAAFVGARVIKRRRQRVAGASVVLQTPTNQYTALPPSPYADVDVVRKPEQHYDSPTSTLTV